VFPCLNLSIIKLPPLYSPFHSSIYLLIHPSIHSNSILKSFSTATTKFSSTFMFLRSSFAAVFTSASIIHNKRAGDDVFLACTTHSTGNLPFQRDDGIDAIKTGCTSLPSTDGTLDVRRFQFSFHNGTEGKSITGMINYTMEGIEGSLRSNALTLSMEPEDCVNYFKQAIDDCKVFFLGL